MWYYLLENRIVLGRNNEKHRNFCTVYLFLRSLVHFIISFNRFSRFLIKPSLFSGVYYKYNGHTVWYPMFIVFLSDYMTKKTKLKFIILRIERIWTNLRNFYTIYYLYNLIIELFDLAYLCTLNRMIFGMWKVIPISDFVLYTGTCVLKKIMNTVASIKISQ